MQDFTRRMDLPRAKVSIGLPVFNGERYLKQALDSILSQTFRDFELVISDNGSNDGTEIICRAMRPAIAASGTNGSRALTV